MRTKTKEKIELEENKKTTSDLSVEFERVVIPLAVHFTSKTNEWTTPSELFNELNKEFNFTLDPCCTHENAKCERHFTIAEDGKQQSWKNERVFMNPPYGREIGGWIRKAFMETRGIAPAELVVCLIPARTDTRYWHDYIFGKAEIRFIKGRLKFGEGKNSAPFPSAIVIFRNVHKAV